jgi:hypothetical protein
LFTLKSSHGQDQIKEVDIDEKSQLRKVIFSFQSAISGERDVFIAGSFNDWDVSRTRMTDLNGDGLYEATLLLVPGRYEYKFFVDGKWATDMSAEELTGAGREGDNAVIRVDERFEGVVFRRGDGQINWQNIPLTLDYAMVNPLGPETIEFRAVAYQDDVERIDLVFETISGEEKSVEMSPLEVGTVFQFFGKKLSIPIYRWKQKYICHSSRLPGGSTGEKTLV